MIDKDKAEKKRLERTKELAKEVKDGTYVDHRTNTRESWFPNRGVIKKDKQVMGRLYNIKGEKSDEEVNEECDRVKLVLSLLR
jgi:hypothetical protein